MELNKIIEGLEDIEAQQGKSVEEYRQEVKSIMENEFEPIRQKLLDGARAMAAQGESIDRIDDGEFGRMLDVMAMTTARMYDILGGNDAIENERDKRYGKSRLRKVRKALGYNL